MNDINIKHFTPGEAKKTLPLVRNIMKDILDYGLQIRTIEETLGGDIEDDEEIQKLTGQLNKFIRELEEIGCYYKDWNFSIGLVDFPSMINGEEVFLCWRSDEVDIRYYHSIEEGYAGRREIPSEYFV